jgi:hypothetical protein
MTDSARLFNKIASAVDAVIADEQCSDIDVIAALATLLKSCIRACGRVEDVDYLLKAVYIQNCILPRMTGQEPLLTWAAALAENLEQLLTALQNVKQEVVCNG